jgi:hypothetical protein
VVTKSSLEMIQENKEVSLLDENRSAFGIKTGSR